MTAEPTMLPTSHAGEPDRSGLADADARLIGIDARRGDLGTGHEATDYRRTGAVGLSRRGEMSAENTSTRRLRRSSSRHPLGTDRRAV